MNKIRNDDVVILYQALLFDEWYSLSEKERKQYIRRMIYAHYGAYKDHNLLALVEMVKDTDVYHYVKDENS